MRINLQLFFYFLTVSLGFSQNSLSKLQIDLVIENYNFSVFSGSRFITLDNKLFVFTSITMPNNKYNNESSKDRMAELKAKQSVNSFINGDQVTSETIHEIEQKTEQNKTNFKEYFREKLEVISKGQIRGIQSIAKFEKSEATTYLFINAPD